MQFSFRYETLSYN
jgi:hypothetical protein